MAETKTVRERLAIVQQSLVAPKNQKNTFGNYNYRSCEDILTAVKPLLMEQGLVMVLNDELVNIGDRYYIKATISLKSAGDTNPEPSVTVTAYAREEEVKKGMDGSQITGASSSYARKYALNGLFLIDDNRDSDATNDGQVMPKTVAHADPTPSREPRVPLMTPAQRDLVKKILDKMPEDDRTPFIVDAIGKESPTNIAEGSALISALMQWQKESDSDE